MVCSEQVAVILMMHLTERMAGSDVIHDQLELPFELRQKSRLRVTLASGREAALFLNRGTILRGGDLVGAETGDYVVQIVAALEPVLRVTANTTRELMCAAYHLGNRHVPLQIGDGWLRLEQDSVLQAMLLGLHVSVQAELAAFEPEAGAYGGGHRHGDAEAPSQLLRPPNRRQHG